MIGFGHRSRRWVREKTMVGHRWNLLHLQVGPAAPACPSWVVLYGHRTKGLPKGPAAPGLCSLCHRTACGTLESPVSQRGPFELLLFQARCEDKD